MQPIFQVMLQTDKIEQTEITIWGKSDKDINVAVVAKVRPEDRAEKRKFGNLGLLAKFGKLIGCQAQTIIERFN